MAGGLWLEPQLSIQLTSRLNSQIRGVGGEQLVHPALASLHITSGQPLFDFSLMRGPKQEWSNISQSTYRYVKDKTGILNHCVLE